MILHLYACHINAQKKVISFEKLLKEAIIDVVYGDVDNVYEFNSNQNQIQGQLTF